MAPAATAELARPPRIPKLTYRNRLPVDDLYLASRASSATSSANNTTGRSYPPTPSVTPTSARDSDSRSTASSQSASVASSDGSSSRESKASSTKKKNGVLNFLTMKEPSQLALEQFAEEQRKKAAAKDGRPTSGRFPTGSAQKLPSSVPKVNSKWDGIPESHKSSPSSIKSGKANSTRSARSVRSTSSQRSSKQPAPSLASNSSRISVATTDSRGPPNSLASPMTSVIDVSNFLSVTPTKSRSRSPSPSPSSVNLPEITSFFPGDPSSRDASPASSADHPWSPPSRPVQTEADPSEALATGLDEKLAISGPDQATSDEVNAIFRRLKGEGGPSQNAYSGIEDEDLEVPDTHNFLFDVKPIVTPPPRASSRKATVQPLAPPPPPRAPSRQAIVQPLSPPVPPPRASSRQATVQPLLSPPIPSVPTRRPPANFSRPHPNQPRPNPPRPNAYAHNFKYSAPALPTLYEVSIASTDDSDEDAASDTTELARANTHGSTQSHESSSSATSIAPSIALSTAPSVANSFTPSVMSASWYRSPRERLGLGGLIRKTDVLPWDESPEKEAAKGHRGKPMKSRLSLFSRS